MHYDKLDVVFQEVPNEISLTFRITGCPLRCKGCHSKASQSAVGIPLTTDHFKDQLNKYKRGVSCVLFMGGEWHPNQLVEYLEIAQIEGFKTCLYTGLENVPDNIKSHLDYLKTGPWIAELGGLNSPTTNQIFTDLNTNKNLNKYFTKRNNNNNNG